MERGTWDLEPATLTVNVKTEGREISEEPAILGSTPVFNDRINIVSPTLPRLEDIGDRITEILSTGAITNHSRYVREFEGRIADFLSVKHCVAVANGTLGLVLSLHALGLSGEVIVPSFTFSATVHALMWSNLTPVFADVLPGTYNLDPDSVAEKITPRTSAILAVHVFGVPCDVEALRKIARDHNVKLLFDSAHAFGSLYDGQPVGGFGDAEVFSFHATKMLPTGEGGAVATNDGELAERIAWARNFGNAGDDDCRFVGLNAKMPEFSAILGLEGLKRIEEYIAQRRRLVEVYTSRLEELPGISFQQITPRGEPTYQDFSIRVDPSEFGLTRDELMTALDREGITTRRYFYPPIHWHQAYRGLYERYNGKLPVTEKVSKNILCLPIWSHMSEEQVEKITFAIQRIYHYRYEVRQTLEVVIT